MHTFPKKLLVFVIVIRILFALLPNIFSLTNPKHDYSSNRWDAPHYLWIAQNGYTNVGDERNFIVFQPLFPLLVRIISFLTFELQTAGILVSVFFAIVASIMLYKLIKIDYSAKTATLAVILLNVFPTSYFLSAPYTESLFLALSIVSLYFSRKQKWLLSATVAGLALLTKHIGVLLFVPLFIEWISQKHKKEDLFLLTAPFVICGAIYLSINAFVFGDPLAFQTILHNHWFKTFVPFWQSLRGSWEIALGGVARYNLEVGWWEAIPITLALFLILFVWKYLRKSYAAYYSVYIIFISSTSFLLSTARYLLAIPPLIIFLALVASKSKFFFVFWSATSIVLLIYFAKTFVSGSWAF